jgi:plasmid stabilization system protein ParE
MKIILDKLASEEYNDAIEYYEFELTGLGEKFKAEIKCAFQTIIKFPHIGFIEGGDIRRYILHKFPYKILYSIEKDYIYVIAIAHTHRDPNYWVNRCLPKK